MAPTTPDAGKPAHESVLLYWSGGKDSALAFHEISTSERYRSQRITRLLTTFTDGYDRVSGHGVRRALIERQADLLGLPLHKTFIPPGANMGQYELVMAEALREDKRNGASLAASGDIFVEKQRVSTFKSAGMKGCFPLWGRTSDENIQAYLEQGFKAFVVCVDSAYLDSSFVGQVLDAELLSRLPPGIDPCGENGEFHTFVFDGPIFKEPIRCQPGEIVLRENYYFCDVVPET